MRRHIVRSKKEGGFALAMCLVMLAAATFIVVPTLSLMTNTYTVSAKAEDATKRFYAAEAGFQNTIYKMTNDQSLHLPAVGQEISVDVPESSLNGKPVSVKLKNEGPHYRVTSSAGYAMMGVTKIIGDAQCSSQAEVFKHAVVSTDGDIVLSGNSDVSSEVAMPQYVYANGDLSLRDNSHIWGGAAAEDDITVTVGARIDGTRTQDAPIIQPPVLDMDSFKMEALAGGTYTGNLSFSNPNGTYYYGPKYITGNLLVNGNQKLNLQGTIYVCGTISIMDNAQVRGNCSLVSVGDIQFTGNANQSQKLGVSEMPFLYSGNGNISISGNGWASAIAYAPKGTINMGDNSKLYGCLVGKSVQMSSNSKVIYPAALLDWSGIPGISPRRNFKLLNYTVE